MQKTPLNQKDNLRILAWEKNKTITVNATKSIDLRQQLNWRILAREKILKPKTS